MVKFTKMQGLGNDFICLNFESVKKYNLKIFSKFVCDRHFGIGADGLILFSNSNVAEFKMRIFNSDGSEAEMCGNGIRCLAKYLYEKGYTNKEQIKIETLAGIKEVKLLVENKKVMGIEVNMGKPQIARNRLLLYTPQNYNNEKLYFEVADKGFEGTFVSLGNPHTVIKVDTLKNFHVQKYGEIIENYKYFPHKTNVEFVQKVDKKNIKIKVWERGVGQTLACGTGAVASAYAMYKANEIEEKVKIELDGGNLEVRIDSDSEEVYMIGPAVEVFEGKIEL